MNGGIHCTELLTVLVLEPEAVPEPEPALEAAPELEAEPVLFALPVLMLGAGRASCLQVVMAAVIEALMPSFSAALRAAGVLGSTMPDCARVSPTQTPI